MDAYEGLTWQPSYTDYAGYYVDDETDMVLFDTPLNETKNGFIVYVIYRSATTSSATGPWTKVAAAVPDTASADFAVDVAKPTSGDAYYYRVEEYETWQ